MSFDMLTSPLAGEEQTSPVFLYLYCSSISCSKWDALLASGPLSEPCEIRIPAIIQGLLIETSCNRKKPAILQEFSYQTTQRQLHCYIYPTTIISFWTKFAKAINGTITCKFAPPNKYSLLAVIENIQPLLFPKKQ